MTAEIFARTAAVQRRSVETLTIPEGLGGTPFEEAYRYQDAYVAAVEPDAGAVGGYKLAVNGVPQQIQVEVPHAVSARIFANEIFDSGITLPVAGFSVACVEPEIAAVLGDGLLDNPTPANRAEARAVIDRFHPAIELIDPRGLKMSPDLIPAAVALNVMNVGIVLGPDSVTPDQLNLTEMTVTMTLDGTDVVQVTDNAPQHPVDAVIWLLHHLAQRGQRVEPGMVVMCGTHVPIWPLAPDVRAVDIDMSGLGAVSFWLQG